MDDKEFLAKLADAEKNGDCPETLVKMATTKWQKQVAVEFVLMDKRVIKEKAQRDTEMKFMKRIMWAIFGVTVLAWMSQLVPQLLPFL